MGVYGRQKSNAEDLSEVLLPTISAGNAASHCHKDARTAGYWSEPPISSTTEVKRKSFSA